MSDSEFGIRFKHQYRKDVIAKDGHRGIMVLSKKINAEHGDVLKKYLSTKKLCEKLWSKLPKEIQDITEVQESWPETLLNEFFPLPK